MSYAPEHLDKWSVDGPTAFDGPSNYVGEDMSELYVAPIGINRDTSDGDIAMSNWHVISQELDKLATHADTGVKRFGHWACGWYELYLIHPSDGAALRCADEWAAKLGDYPVADEMDWSERECAAVSDNWSQATLRDRVEACQRCNISVFAARRDELPEDDNGRLFEYLREW